MSIKRGGRVVPGIDRKGDDGQFRTLRPGGRIPQQGGAELLAAAGLVDGQASRVPGAHRRRSPPRAKAQRTGKRTGSPPWRSAPAG